MDARALLESLKEQAKAGFVARRVALAALRPALDDMTDPQERIAAMRALPKDYAQHGPVEVLVASIVTNPRYRPHLRVTYRVDGRRCGEADAIDALARHLATQQKEPTE